MSRQINSLFVADDRLLLASGVAEETVEVMRNAKGRFGLELNLAKSKC